MQSLEELQVFLSLSLFLSKPSCSSMPVSDGLLKIPENACCVPITWTWFVHFDSYLSPSYEHKFIWQKE